MAKKDKKRKASRKDGVTLPKDLRKTAETVMALAQSPIAREVAAAALAAGAAALAKRGTERAAADGSSRIKPAEVGALLAQGLAALLGGMGKPADAPAGGKPAAAVPQADGTPKPPR